MNSLVKDSFKKLGLLQSQHGLDFLWGRWSWSRTRHSLTLFPATCCPGKTFWCQLGRTESAKIIQTRLGGLEILPNTEDAQLVQTVVRQQVAQMLCDTGAAPESLTEKNDGNGLLQNLIICKEEGRDFIKNKQTDSCLVRHHQSARPQVFLFYCHGSSSLSMNDDQELRLADSSLN